MARALGAPHKVLLMTDDVDAIVSAAQETLSAAGVAKVTRGARLVAAV